jgi:hypothetical protein
VHDHYVIILWPLPLISQVFLLLWLHKHFGVLCAAMVLLVTVSLLQGYSFYHREQLPWKNFATMEAQYGALYGTGAQVYDIGTTWR